MTAQLTVYASDVGGLRRAAVSSASARQIHNGPTWLPMDASDFYRDHLQNRWSASLAMSTDGSFPSRPRHFKLGQRS